MSPRTARHKGSRCADRRTRTSSSFAAIPRFCGISTKEGLKDGSILSGRGGSRCPAFSRHLKELSAAEKFPDSSKRFALRGMVPSPTPKRDHGDPQTFRLRSEGKGEASTREGDYSSGSVGGSFFFAFRLMLIAAAGPGCWVHRESTHVGRLTMAASVWKGHIAFGMVSLPVKLRVAARS